MKNLKDIVELYDALVMVHPDYTEPINPDYEKNLQDIIKIFESMKKPVFVVRPIKTEKMHGYLSNAITVPVKHPESEKDDAIEFYQREIDFIAKHVKKSPKDIRLAFGGTFATACVYAYATSWCEVVEIRYASGKKFEPPKNPIKYGKVLEEIV